MEQYFIFITKDGKYVGVDLTSGGYHYISDNPFSVCPFRTAQKAREYAMHFSESSSWILKEFKGFNVENV